MKMKLFAFLILATFTLTACGPDPFRPDISYMPEDQKQNNEKLLQDALTGYNSTDDQAAKADHAEEVAFRHMLLGNYREAIKYYEKVLEYDDKHFPSLTNVASMYEEAGDFEKAVEYGNRLYRVDPTNKEVVSDMIRFLVKSGRHSDAQGVLEAFSRYDKESGNNYGKFISDQFGYILEARKNTQK